MTLGGGTMLFGAVIALRQRDLKLLLAYGTVSQLGLMTLLIGCGNPDALLGGLAMLIAHATFKAPLFFVVGIIDTSTGTRDLTKLSGPAKEHAGGRRDGRAGRDLAWPGSRRCSASRPRRPGTRGCWTAAPPAYIGTAVMAVGSALTVAYSARFLWGAFSDKPGVDATDAEAASPWMTGPTMLLVVLGLVLGIFPALLEPLLQSYAQTAGPDPRGRDGALARARAAAGAVRGRLAGRRRRSSPRNGPGSARTEIARPGGEPGAGYRATTRGVDALAVGVTAATQRGSLPVSLGAILLVLVAFPGTMLIRAGTGPADVEVLGEPAELVLSLVILGLAVATVRVQARAHRGDDGRRRRLRDLRAVHPARRARPGADPDPGRDRHADRGAAGAHPAAGHGAVLLAQGQRLPGGRSRSRPAP